MGHVPYATGLQASNGKHEKSTKYQTKKNYFSAYSSFGSRNSATGIATELRAGRPRGRSSSADKVKMSLLCTSPRPILGPTQPPTQWVPGAISPSVKGQGREADHSPPNK
jgi:hypothetical protein